MDVRRHQYLGILLVLTLFVSGLYFAEYVNAPKADPDPMTGDTVCRWVESITPDRDTACTTEMLGIRDCTGTARTNICMRETRRDTDANAQSLNFIIIPLNDRLSCVPSAQAEWIWQGQGKQVVSYIHKSDGEKEPDDNFIRHMTNT